jgi:hypothetical protein
MVGRAVVGRALRAGPSSGIDIGLGRHDRRGFHIERPDGSMVGHQCCSAGARSADRIGRAAPATADS